MGGLSQKCALVDAACITKVLDGTVNKDRPSLERVRR